MNQLLQFIGVVLGIFGFIWGVIIAFREHWLWGLSTFFIPLIWIIYAILRCRKTWLAILCSGLGGFMYISAGGVPN